MTNIKKTQEKLLQLKLLTNLFEKEVIIFVYYALFTCIILDDLFFGIQFVFFGIGTFLQIYFKWKNKFRIWNNFFSCLFFLFGSVLSSLIITDQNLFFTGFFTFIFVISLFSAVYEKWKTKIKNTIISWIFQFLYSAIVLMSFPTLYFIFMKNKLDIDLLSFFNDENHFIVFSGYFVFYFLILLNKQLLSVQTSVLQLLLQSSEQNYKKSS